MAEPTKDSHSEINSLEGSSDTTVISPTNGAASSIPSITSSQPPTDSDEPSPSGPKNPKKMNPLRNFARRFNIYILLFVLLLIIATVVAVVLYFQALSKNASNNTVQSQELSQSTLNQLSTSDVTVGEPKHTLSVQSNAVFTGSVLMRSNLQIAGTLQVGSNVAINGVRVTGSSTFDDVQITKSISVTGNSSVQGQLSVQQGLNVNGSGTFLGAISAPSITAGSLQLSGDLKLTHHIAAGGGTPSRSNGSALGGGGTVSVSGSDTAGSITINTGTSPGPGCFVTINFTAAFNSTPHIIVTPVGPSAAGLAYYINRSTTNFSLCTNSSPPGGASFGFDYIAFD